MAANKTNIIAIKQVERIIKNAGAASELEKELVDYGTKISREAILIAIDTKRQTVKTEDIKLAMKD